MKWLVRLKISKSKQTLEGNIMYKIKPGKYYLGDPCYAELKMYFGWMCSIIVIFLEAVCFR